MTTLYVGGLVLRLAAGAATDADAHTALLLGEEGVMWSGSDAEARHLSDAASRVVHLGGALVAPGFVDAHVHLSSTGALLRGVDLASARSLTEALASVETAARRLGGRPLLAQGWDETRWPERRPFTAAELDRASYGGVVYAPRVDGHSAVVSSALAAAAGLPTGGSGLLRTQEHHRAREAFDTTVTPGQRRDDIRAALERAAAVGIVALHEMGGPVVSSSDDVAAVADLTASDEGGRLPRVERYWGELAGSTDEALALLREHPGVAGLAGDLNIDGSIGSRTARLRRPYADDAARLGEAFLTASQVRDHVVACTRAHTTAGFHVIGDAGADTAVAGFEAAAEVVGTEALRGRRHRLEHLEMVDADGATRLARLGVVASMQPAFDAAWGGPAGMYADRLGPARAHRMNPFRTLLDAGVPLLFGSDSPVTPMAPWEGVRAAVHHHDEQERITADEAFRAHVGGPPGSAGPARAREVVLWDGWEGWVDPRTARVLTPPEAGPAPHLVDERSL